MKKQNIKTIKIPKLTSHSINSNSLLLEHNIDGNLEKQLNSKLIINQQDNIEQNLTKRSKNVNNQYNYQVCHTTENIKQEKNEQASISLKNRTYQNNNNKSINSIVNKTDESANLKEEEKDIVNPINYDITQQPDKIFPLTIGTKRNSECEIDDVNSCDALTLWKKTLRSSRGISTMKKVVDKYKAKQQQKNRQSILMNLALIENDFMPKQEITTQKRKCIIPVLNPESTIVIIWNIIVSLLMMYTAIIMPFRIAFIETDSTFWKVLETIIDFLFLLDIVVTFNVGYNDENEDLINDRGKIAWKYFTGWFFVDLITTKFDVFSKIRKSTKRNRSSSIGQNC